MNRCLALAAEPEIISASLRSTASSPSGREQFTGGMILSLAARLR